MTFKLYRVAASNSVYYDYSINDLAGYYDSPSLSNLTESIVNNQALILKECVNLADYHKNIDDDTPHAMTINLLRTITMLLVYTKAYILTYSSNSPRSLSNIRNLLLPSYRVS